MNQGMLAIKSSKTQYSEQEAAKELGVTVEELRALIRSHIAESDEDLNNVADGELSSFRPVGAQAPFGSKGNPTAADSAA